MKLIGTLFVAISLAVGVVAAASAYMPAIDQPEALFIDSKASTPQETVYLKTAAAIGGRDASKNVTQSFDEGTELSPENLDAMRKAGVLRVKVKQFSFKRWGDWWIFACAAGGLVFGAWLVRRENARLVARLDSDEHGKTLTPLEAIEQTNKVLLSLLDRLPVMPTHKDREAAIVRELGEVQQTHMVTFADGRPRLISRYGLTGFAEIMDAFAALERQINRCWSAAADGHAPEAMTCLKESEHLASDLRERLNRDRK